MNLNASPPLTRPEVFMQPLTRNFLRARKPWALALLALGGLFLGSSRSPRVMAAESRRLSLEERVDCQQRLERVDWQYRIWPKENPHPKPALDELMPRSLIRAKVEDDLRKSQALAAIWGRPLSAAQLQREMIRMARDSKQPARLRAQWDALGNDSFLIAECVARP